jgi:hydroxyethylthiazole kinase-like uncharacterized protein yjeF
MNRLDNALLTITETRMADQITIDSGISGFKLLQQAGKAAFNAITQYLSINDRILVMCGVGNNGGDGLVVAAHLIEHGYTVTTVLIGDKQDLRHEASKALDALPQSYLEWSCILLEEFTVVVDALIGAGLNRPVAGVLEEAIDAINASNLKVISIDIPSGVNGDSGEVYGTAIEASYTVTFFRKKTGHLLYPGRFLCGSTVVVQIGIDPSVLSSIRPTRFENGPLMWQDTLPVPTWNTHKYKRGHALIVSGGPISSGAARLAARASLRVGAGLVSIIGSKESSLVNAAHVTAEMIKVVSFPVDLQELLQDNRYTSITFGPGFGTGETTHEWVKVMLIAASAVVLDADALTSFEECPEMLFDWIKKSEADVVITPHAGEFTRLFKFEDVDRKSKIEVALCAAKLSGAIVVFKGPDSVIAHPDGRTVINAIAPPWLATAGTGDVLAGTIGGCLAQNVNAFDAACAACWIHSRAAQILGPGMIASDLETRYPEVLQSIYRL